MTVKASSRAAVVPVLEQLLVGRSEAMCALRRLVTQIAPTNASVLITGPSGSGKEMVARALHVESERANNAFVAINCGAIPHDLLESQLFGHERGSFTGAVSQMRGKFEDADRGTLFLDEIGDMPPQMQVKLLRVLEERSVTRIGGRGPIEVDIRLVSATHRDLDSAIAGGTFREDLFYRLAVLPISLPALSKRLEDIPLLVEHFLVKLSGGKPNVSFSEGALGALMTHRWPGNIRELKNFVERAAILCSGHEIAAKDVDRLLNRTGSELKLEHELLWAMSEPREARAPATREKARDSGSEGPLDLPVPAPSGPVLGRDRPIDLKAMVAEFENRHIVEALQISGGVVAEAARLLSMQRTTLIEKMQKYGIQRAAA